MPFDIDEPRVDAEWETLECVALVRPQFFVVGEPVNVTQERFYGTEGQPGRAGVLAQHEAVRQALIDEHISVVDVPPDPRFPLQFNVRDAAAIVGTQCILGRMARPVRVGEAELVRAQLPEGNIAHSIDVGRLEGGDIIVTPTAVIVGLSQRTDRRGAHELQDLVGPTRAVCRVELAPDVLHLDVAMNLLSPDVGIMHRPSIVGPLPELLRTVDWIEVTDEEYAEQGANLLSLGPRHVAFDARHRRIGGELRSRGFDCLSLELDEITKVGGGIRCMTLPLRRVRQFPMSPTDKENP